MEKYFIIRSYLIRFNTFPFILFLSISILSAIIINSEIMAWGRQVHDQMTTEAIKVVSSTSLFSAENAGRYRVKLRFGSLEPDISRVISHINICQPRAT